MACNSWVDDCPSGVLNHCAMDKKSRKFLTKTAAAFDSYDQALNPKDSSKTDAEEFINYDDKYFNRKLLLLLLLLGFFYLLVA